MDARSRKARVFSTTDGDCFMNTALIFAGGRGERLRPLTDYIPKPLYRIEGVPLIERHVTRLALAGFKTILINHAHLGGLIRQHLGDGSRFNVRIQYLPEPPGGLETGGTLYQALAHVGSEPFAAINTDIVTDYPFEKLHTLSSTHLVLVPKPIHVAQGDFGLTADNKVCNENKQWTFSGIAVYQPQHLMTLKLGRYSITPWLRQWADANRLDGEVYFGVWRDIGTLE